MHNLICIIILHYILLEVNKKERKVAVMNVQLKYWTQQPSVSDYIMLVSRPAFLNGVGETSFHQTFKTKQAETCNHLHKNIAGRWLYAPCCMIGSLCYLVFLVFLVKILQYKMYLWETNWHNILYQRKASSFKLYV